MLLKRIFDFFLFFAFRDLWRPIIKFELEIPNGSALFRCMLFVNERPPLLVPKRSQGVRDVVMSSKPKCSEARWQLHKWKNIPLCMLIVCKKKIGKYTGLSLCCTGLQQVKSANWNLFANAKEKLRSAQVKSLCSHSQLQIQHHGAFQDLLSSSG